MFCVSRLHIVSVYALYWILGEARTLWCVVVSHHVVFVHSIIRMSRYMVSVVDRVSCVACVLSDFYSGSVLLMVMRRRMHWKAVSCAGSDAAGALCEGIF